MKTNFIDSEDFPYYICRDKYGWEWRFWRDAFIWCYQMVTPKWPVSTFNHPYTPEIPGML